MALKNLLQDAPKQAFVVSHHDEKAFHGDGLRRYATYRDLGFAKATGGLVEAQVIRLKSPCTDEVRQRHYHDVDLQMVFVLKGMMKIEIEGHGEVTMRAGSAFIVPAKARHTVLDYGGDCEVLEINMPSNFATVKV